MSSDPVTAALAGGPPVVFLLTGVPAAGKSTVAQLLAERFPRSAHVRGDIFRRMVVRGRVEATPSAEPEMARQLRLRHSLAAATADGYHACGFTTGLQDCFLEGMLPFVVSRLRSRPLFVVVLAPTADVVRRREQARGKRAYGSWTVEDLDHRLREGLRTSGSGWTRRGKPPRKRWKRSSPGATASPTPSRYPVRRWV